MSKVKAKRAAKSEAVSETEKENMGNLEAQRAELAEKLASLKMPAHIDEMVRTAGEAVSAFKSEAAAYERQIDEIDLQIGARERHRREEAERARQQQLADMRKRLVALAEDRLKAVAEAEAGARQLAASLTSVLEINRSMAALAHTLSGDRGTPHSMNENELVSQLSARIAAIMVGIPKYRARFGASCEWFRP